MKEEYFQGAYVYVVCFFLWKRNRGPLFVLQWRNFHPNTYMLTVPKNTVLYVGISKNV